MKYEDTIVFKPGMKIPAYSYPSCPPNVLYFVKKTLRIGFPKRKDGKPDMRFSINKLLHMRIEMDEMSGFGSEQK